MDKQTRLDEAAEAKTKGDVVGAEQIYHEILSKDAGNNESALREQEVALIQLGELYRDQKDVNKLVELIKTSRTIMSSFAKAKTAKIVRTLIDLFSTIPDTTQIQIEVTKDCISWAVTEKRTFMRLSLQTRLVALYLESQNYHDALTLSSTLLKELRRLDDKMVLVEVQLLESRVYHALRNIPKSRASLTSARTAANAIYCPPIVQAGLDMQSGILLAEDKDYKTAYSYFYEGLEGYNSQDDPKAIMALKYMLLSKVMLNLTDDVYNIITGKLAQKYQGRDIDAMKAVANAHKNRSLSEFQKSLEDFRQELMSDPIIRTHFTSLYDNLLEQNLLRIVEPFSRVEVAHVAALVGLPVVEIEFKLSQMILDRVFHGVLDHSAGCLIVFEEQGPDKTYDAALETVKHMSTVVDLLYEKAGRMQTVT